LLRPLRTLRARIALAAGAAILAAVVLFAVVTVLVVDHQLRGSLDTALRDRALQVAQLAISAPAVLNSPGALEGPSSGRQISVQVLDARGRLVARSLALGAQLLPQDALERAARLHGRAGVETVSVGGRPLRMYAAPIADAGTPASGGVVLVASDTSDIAHTTGSLGVVVGLSGAGVVVLAAIAAAAQTRRGLRPLSLLAEGAGEIERTADPSQRLPEAPSRDEIGQLTGVLNRMLASLEQARAGERRFLADASHELRTPVTALLGNVEYAVRHGADPDVLADLQRDAARLARLVDDLLALERAGAPAAEPEPLALDQFVRALVSDYDGDGGALVAAPLATVSVRADSEALARAVANLIDNAVVHGPVSGRVTVGVRHEGDRALLTVSDDGPGPAPADREHLFERFWRAPSASERPGSGLGLSIVAAIAERYGGCVTVDGSAFTIDLPAA
jgi:signal transduction histidine kinase